MRALQRYNCFWGLKPNKKTTNGGARFSIKIGNKIKLNIPLHLQMGAGGNGLILKNQKFIEKCAP